MYSSQVGMAPALSTIYVGFYSIPTVQILMILVLGLFSLFCSFVHLFLPCIPHRSLPFVTLHAVSPCILEGLARHHTFHFFFLLAVSVDLVTLDRPALANSVSRMRARHHNHPLETPAYSVVKGVSTFLPVRHLEPVFSETIPSDCQQVVVLIPQVSLPGTQGSLPWRSSRSLAWHVNICLV